MIPDIPYTKKQEEAQADWAKRYKALVNDNAVREKLVLHSGLIGVCDLGVPANTYLYDRGTIYQTFPKDPEAAHYMAYRFVNSPRWHRTGTTIEVYDPASMESGFSNDQLLSDLRKTFKIPGVEVIDMHHQIDLYDKRDKIIWQDTWCQSWTIAWLDNTMRFWLTKKVETYEEAMDLALRIVREIVLRLNFYGIPGGKELMEEWFQGGYGNRARFARFYIDEPMSKVLSRVYVV